MGSFAVGCGVSNLPIKNYDPVVFVFLVKNSNKENRTFLLHNDDLYKPFLLPIKGTYNDYGTLENIEKDINVELIEKHYKVNIETLLELVSESGGNVLSKYSPYLKAYDIKKLNLENTSESLLKNGFNLENNDSYEYFYNKEYDIKIENINKQTYKIVIHNKDLKELIIKTILAYDWKGYKNHQSAPSISKEDIYTVLEQQIPEIN